MLQHPVPFQVEVQRQVSDNYHGLVDWIHYNKVKDWIHYNIVNKQV